MGAIEAVTIDEDVHCSVIGSARAIGIVRLGTHRRLREDGRGGGGGRNGAAGAARSRAAAHGARGTAPAPPTAGVEVFVLVRDADAGKNERRDPHPGRHPLQLQLAKRAQSTPASCCSSA